MPTPKILPPSISSRSSTNTVHDVEPAPGDITISLDDLTKIPPKTEVIDTQAPLVLRSGKANYISLHPHVRIGK